MSQARKLLSGVLLAFISIVVLAVPVLAIALPSPAPSLATFSPASAFRNILEIGDELIVLYEVTPYASIPTTLYKYAFIWRWMNTDNTEIAQALGYTYTTNGYGYNVISFYLSATQVVSHNVTWGVAYPMRLSGTPTAFASPPIYNFSPSINYDTATSSSVVQADIAALIIGLAHDLDTQWGLTGTTADLVTQSEAGQALSSYGQSFFRGAIFGVQALAPAAFDLNIGNTTGTGYTPAAGGNTYSSNLSGLNTGNPIGTSLNYGNQFLGSSYNLFGLLIVIIVFGSITAAHWAIVGGNSAIWRGLIESTGPTIILGRIAVTNGIDWLALVAAICWLVVSAKLWRLI